MTTYVILNTIALIGLCMTCLYLFYWQNTSKQIQNDKIANDSLTKITNLGWEVKVPLVLAVIFVSVSFFAPFVLTQPAINKDFDFSDKGEIGDAISGIMNPFIALAGVMVTGLAFYIQYKANKLQRELFRQELDFNKFENQFYEMLRLHKENVNEIQIDVVKVYLEHKDYPEKNRFESKITGRQAFTFMMSEFELLYYIAKKHWPLASSKALINEAYGTFFLGLNYSDKSKHEFFVDVEKLKMEHEINDFTTLPNILTQSLKLTINFKDNLHFKLFEGYSYQLAHYYRHLYQTVKFVVNQDESFLTYNEKRKYLRILRSQLSNQEQLMLFYNWLSDFGNNWEDSKNKFFTDYRMIHNLYDNMLVDSLKLRDFLNLDKAILNEDNRHSDPLFEFEEWKRS